MKVAIFTETYFPFISGVVTHIKTLKESLEHAGHEVLIVTTSPKAVWDGNNDQHPELRGKGKAKKGDGRQEHADNGYHACAKFACQLVRHQA